MDEIKRMQDILLLIRRAVGWTAEEFGNQIGVTRQTINNIENGRNRLTKTQYIAMRSVLDAEIAKYPDETEMLQTILDIFVDHSDKYKKEELENLIAKANLVTPSILAGTATRKAVSKEWMQAAGALGVTVAIAAAPVGIVDGLMRTWLMKVTAGTNKKSKSKDDE